MEVEERNKSQKVNRSKVMKCHKNEECKYCGDENQTVILPNDTGDSGRDIYVCLECLLPSVFFRKLGLNLASASLGGEDG